MRNEKNKPRIDTSGERIPLTDNPFAQLAALRPTVAASTAEAAAAPKPKAEILPPKPKFHVERTRKGGYHLAVEKRAAGKVVTIVRGVDRGAEELLGKLKKLCGAGGAIREDGVEVQGDHRERIERFLKEQLL